MTHLKEDDFLNWFGGKYPEVSSNVEELYVNPDYLGYTFSTYYDLNGRVFFDLAVTAIDLWLEGGAGSWWAKTLLGIDVGEGVFNLVDATYPVVLFDPYLQGKGNQYHISAPASVYGP